MTQCEGGVERIRLLPPPVPSLVDDGRASLGTLLVLLGGGTARAYRSYELLAFDDRHGTLSGQHPPAQGGDDCLDDRGVRPQCPARPPETCRGRGFALRDGCTRCTGAVHTAKRHQIPTDVTHRHANLDIEFLRFGYRRLDHPIRFRQCESHMLTSLSKGQRERAVSGGCGTGRPKPCADTVAPRAAPEIGPYRLPDFHADTADRFGPSVAPGAWAKIREPLTRRYNLSPLRGGGFSQGRLDLRQLAPA